MISRKNPFNRLCQYLYEKRDAQFAEEKRMCKGLS